MTPETKEQVIERLLDMETEELIERLKIDIYEVAREKLQAWTDDQLIQELL